MGLTTRNILVAATEVVVPVALTYLALDGCAEMVETVRQVGEAEGRPDLRVTKVVPTLYRKTALADAILERLKAYFPDALGLHAAGLQRQDRRGPEPREDHLGVRPQQPRRARCSRPSPGRSTTRPPPRRGERLGWRERPACSGRLRRGQDFFCCSTRRASSPAPRAAASASACRGPAPAGCRSGSRRRASRARRSSAASPRRRAGWP